MTNLFTFGFGAPVNRIHFIMEKTDAMVSVGDVFLGVFFAYWPISLLLAGDQPGERKGRA